MNNSNLSTQFDVYTIKFTFRYQISVANQLKHIHRCQCCPNVFYSLCTNGRVNQLLIYINLKVCIFLCYLNKSTYVCLFQPNFGYVFSGSRSRSNGTDWVCLRKTVSYTLKIFFIKHSAPDKSQESSIYKHVNL